MIASRHRDHAQTELQLQSSSEYCNYPHGQLALDKLPNCYSGVLYVVGWLLFHIDSM